MEDGSTKFSCVQAVRRLGGVKSQSASERWKKKQKKDEEPTKVHDSVLHLKRDFSFQIYCTGAVDRRGQAATGETDWTGRPTGCHWRLQYPI